MSTLQRLMNEQRADAAAGVSHACFVTKPNPAVLAVLTSSGPVWLLGWNHFVFARLELGDERDLLALRFVAVEVAARGLHLGGLQDPLTEMRVALLRAAPTRYQKASAPEPFIASRHVAPLGNPGADVA